MEQKKQTKQKRGWLITSVALMLFSTALAAGLGAALMIGGKTQQMVERTYEQNLYDLGDNLQNIEINLSKLMVAPDGSLAAGMLTDLYTQATCAEKSLSTLPVDYRTTEETAHFLNRVADFSMSYQRALLAGNEGRAFADNVENMYVAARQLRAEIEDSVSLVAQHKLDIRKITASKPYAFRHRKGEEISHNTVEYPEMIYDGPFSDGRECDCYHYFEGQPTVTLQEAKDIALAALPDFGGKTVTDMGKTEEEPFYELTVKGDRGEAYFSIAEHGGKIVNLTVSRGLGAVMLGETSAKACAKDFAARLGYDVEPVWYLQNGGVAYVNLAPVENDVVLYTDLVKVKVALDNGEPLGLEAKNYCLNHMPRETALTMNRAAIPTLIDKKLQIKNIRGALIPLDNDTERLCYEVACEYKGLDYFIYLDAGNGETVKIMRTVDSEQGSLVM